jgi:hypothetical protein
MRKALLLWTLIAIAALVATGTAHRRLAPPRPVVGAATEFRAQTARRRKRLPRQTSRQPASWFADRRGSDRRRVRAGDHRGDEAGRVSAAVAYEMEAVGAPRGMSVTRDATPSTPCRTLVSRPCRNGSSEVGERVRGVSETRGVSIAWSTFTSGFNEVAGTLDRLVGGSTVLRVSHAMSA